MPDDRYEALRAALPGVQHQITFRGRVGDREIVCSVDPTTVRALLDERDAWRALGREQMRECVLGPEDGCAFCISIQSLLDGEEP